MSAYEAILRDESALNLRPWLYRITHNTSLNALRDRGLRHDQLDERIDGVERPDQALERSQGLRDVVAAVNALPERQRDAIVLRELEGRSYEEIAAELGVTGGSVRQLLNRARNTLRAGATAVTPVGLLLRIPWAAPTEPAATRVAELCGAAGAGAGVVTAKVCATALVTAAAVGGVAAGPARDGDDRASGPDGAATSAASGGSSGGSAASADAGRGGNPGGEPGGTDDAGNDRQNGRRGQDEREDRRRRGRDGEDDRSGPGGGEHGGSGSDHECGKRQRAGRGRLRVGRGHSGPATAAPGRAGSAPAPIWRAAARAGRAGRARAAAPAQARGSGSGHAGSGSAALRLAGSFTGGSSRCGATPSIRRATARLPAIISTPGRRHGR